MKLHIATRSSAGNEYGDDSLKKEFPSKVDIEVSDDLAFTPEELTTIIEGGLDLVYEAPFIKIGNWGDNGVTFQDDCVSVQGTTLIIKFKWCANYGASDSNNYLAGNGGEAVLSYDVEKKEYSVSQ